MREQARRLARSGVTANCLHPGFVAIRFGDSAAARIDALARELRNRSSVIANGVR
jgi:hypothetical protein